MFSRYARHSEFVGTVRGFPPIKFGNISNLVSGKERAIPNTRYKSWSMLGVQSYKCLNVQMIVMIMTDQHDIDWR